MQDDEATGHDATIADIRERTIAAAYRCVALAAAQLAHDHEICPRHACRRAQRCRGRICRLDAE